MLTPYAYFPTSAVVSLQYATKRGNTYQVALIGHEGMVGASTFMGGNSISSGVVVYPGKCYRIERCKLLQAFNQNVQVQNVLLSYIQSLMAQMSQIAVCGRHHRVDQQLCSLLLLCCDRFMSDSFVLTHGQLADMLGVRREGVTLTAHRLQADGVIRYTRGHIKILDRAGLESRACECYALVKAEAARLLPFQGSASRLAELRIS